MKEKIAAMPMKSICVGRFLVDVPQHAIVTYRPATVSGWDILTTQETDADFNLRLQKKEDQLAASKNERNGVSLESAHKIQSADVTGKIFVFDRRWIGLIRSGKEVMSEAVSIDALVRSNGFSYDFKAKLRKPERFEQLEKILHQLQAVHDPDIPTGGGFCFDHGLIRDPLTVDNHEYVSIFLGTREQPDLAISLSSFGGATPGKTLLQRHEASNIQREYSSRFHDFRIGPRVINGVSGEEVLQRVHEFNGVKLHDFMWESIGDKDDVLLPELTLELTTGLGQPGAPVNSSLSDVEALALWEKISSSLRRRPLQ